MTGKDLFETYFQGQSAFDELEKAHFAYHEDSTTHQNGHKWPSGLFQHTIEVQRHREVLVDEVLVDEVLIVNQDMPDRIRFECCIHCGRSRFDVRWDNEPAYCTASVGRPTISDVIVGEEENFYATLNSAESKIPEVLAKRFKGELTSESLFFLQSSIGYPPDIVACFVDQDIEPLMDGFNELMREHQAKSGVFVGV